MAPDKKNKQYQPLLEENEHDIEKNSDVVFKINFSRNTANIAIELTGPEDYIKRMEPVVNGYIRFLDEYAYDYGSEAHETDHKSENGSAAYDPTSIAEALEKLSFDQISEMIIAHRFNFKDIDMVLLAGAFIQQNSPQRTFSTREISKYLKMTNLPAMKNPSHSIKLNLDAGRVVQSDKDYSLTEEGIDRVIRTFSPLFYK